MLIEVDASSLSETKPHEYALRFLFGGTCTAIAGLIANRYGPAVGGLFLAFPAIFPAAASLIQDHEKRRKAAIGKDGSRRGKNAAALDAFGATLGCLGLIAFALVLWKFADGFPPVAILGIAFASWALIAFAAWLVRQHWPRRRRRQTHNG
ncbi:MAG: DUF3147 family protein [Terracidiphilus sp.]|jgi:hypothetical protein